MQPDDLAGVADAVATAAGGTVVEFAPASGPTASVVVADRHLVLVREHPRTYSICLPAGPAWDCADRAGAEVLGPEIAAAIAAAPAGVSIMDVAAALAGEVPGWVLSHPGTAVPAEAWLHERGPGTAGGSIGLFQDGAEVRIVVWDGPKHQEKVIRSRRGFEKLDWWLFEALGRQRAAFEAAAAEQARRDALPVPTVAEVMARLRAGEEIATGGGRAWTAYRMGPQGQLLRVDFDEGDTQEGPATETELAATIAAYPDRFKPR